MTSVKTNLHGGPGTGKTARVIDVLESQAQAYGLNRVCAITYSRAGGDEIRQRLADRLGIRADKRSLDRLAPFIGTVHSVAYRLLGMHGNQMANERMSEFCVSMSMEAPSEKGFDPQWLDALYFVSEAPTTTEADTLLRTLSMARNCEISFSAAFERLPIASQVKTDVVRLSWLADQYLLWKKEMELLDYEDLLEQAAMVPLPVRFLVLDEAQDSSPLLWRCVSAWADSPDCKRFLAAGDPYQAIHQWAGASPELFLNRPGEWKRLRRSHRLTPPAALYARQVLDQGGWGDVLSFWRGVSDGEETDGTTAYLARTHTLSSMFESELMGKGEPYVALRGISPWTSKAGDAYRALVQLDAEGLIRADQLKGVAKQLPNGFLPYGLAAKIERMSGLASWPEELTVGVRDAMRYLPQYDYFSRVERLHGTRALFKQPKTFVGTIHGAKGKQFQDVYLADSWARLPARSLVMDEGARRSEACVAFVGTSRQQRHLEIVPGLPGTPYSFP